jgi:hypothetical protein
MVMGGRWATTTTMIDRECSDLSALGKPPTSAPSIDPATAATAYFSAHPREKNPKPIH